MRNSRLIIVLTVLVSVLCLYSLTFTFISRGVQKDATEAATDAIGDINLNKKQKYLDSIYTEPVFSMAGIDYTYKEVKEKELSLGLDLQGGMHVVLEVSPVEILKALAGSNAKTPQFQQALKRTQEKLRESNEKYTNLFYASYAEVTNGESLNKVFVNTFTKEKGININSSDAEIKGMIEREVEQATSRAEKILRTRIDKFGVISPNIQRLQGSQRIQLELPGVENPQRVRNLLQGVAQLEFMPVYFYEEVDPVIRKINDYLLTIEKPNANKAAAVDTTKAATEEDNLFATDSTKKSTAKDSAASAKAKADSTKKQEVSSFLSLRSGHGFFSYRLKDTAKINAILNNETVRTFIPSNMKFLWEKARQANPEAGDDEMVVDLIAVNTAKGKTMLGDVVVNADFVIETTKGAEATVHMAMNSAGTKKWKQMTREATEDKSQYEGNRRIAIVLDDIVQSAPRVQNEIPNGQSVITGNFTRDEATDLVTVLEAGKLPAPVRIVEEVVIGPSLGKEAIAQGLNSMLVGLLVVVVFMVFYYSKGGFVADIALLFNVLFILGVMANFNAVLTLPGIAGMVLTIGMAVDANVLIFERIREELSLGKPIKTAIDLGYDKAFSSIFDSNVTTIISGIFLYWLGSGPVQGFAITLIIGLLTSFFTSVYISKAIVLWLTKDKDPKSVSFSTFLSRNMFKSFNFNFIGKRKPAYIISTVIFVVGIISIVAQGGLNLGVDFKGGRSYVVEFKNPVVASDIKEKLEPNFENAGTEVKAYGSNTKMKITTSYLINEESSDADNKVLSALEKGLNSISAKGYEIQSSAKVGATVADDIITDSIWAIAFSLIGIFAYVFIRFKNVSYSIGGVVALLHDAFMVIAVFSILRWIGISYEIDQVFVAAILTIVGFSINDTVIVFDRVREFLAENTRTPMPQVINGAINHTLSRTIITTLTVLIVVIILLVFGGETLRGFSVAMLVGIISGTYSTIYIAVPMVLDIKTSKTTTPNTADAVAAKKVAH